MLWPKSKKNYTAWAESTVFIRPVNLLKSRFMLENSTTLAIAHVNDFEYLLPDVDLSPTSTSNSRS